MLKISKIREQYGKKLQIYKSKWSNSFYIADFKYYPNISYHTELVKSMCKITKIEGEILKWLKLPKTQHRLSEKNFPMFVFTKQ